MTTFAKLPVKLSAVIPKLPVRSLNPGYKPRNGLGYLAGEFPGGLTTVEGVPVTATVRVHYRPAEGSVGDGTLVAQVQSAADGTWRVDNLDPSLTFDVIGRLDGYNDVIVAGVKPTPY